MSAWPALYAASNVLSLHAAWAKGFNDQTAARDFNNHYHFIVPVSTAQSHCTKGQAPFTSKRYPKEMPPISPCFYS